jgi:hypothetical protein
MITNSTEDDIIHPSPIIPYAINMAWGEFGMKAIRWYESRHGLRWDESNVRNRILKAPVSYWELKNIKMSRERLER